MQVKVTITADRASYCFTTDLARFVEDNIAAIEANSALGDQVSDTVALLERTVSSYGLCVVSWSENTLITLQKVEA